MHVQPIILGALSHVHLFGGTLGPNIEDTPTQSQIFLDRLTR